MTGYNVLCIRLSENYANNNMLHTLGENAVKTLILAESLHLRDV